jgi:hypothetical protein
MLSVSIVVTNKETLLSSSMEFVPLAGTGGGVRIETKAHGELVEQMFMSDQGAVEHATESLLAAMSVAFDDMNPGRGTETDVRCLEGLLSSFDVDPMAN